MLKRIIQKWNDTPAAAKSAIAFTISSLILRGIAFITTPIFTRMMSSTQYGIVSTYNSWNSILEVFALLGLTSAGVFNTGLNDYKSDRDRFISSILILCNVCTSIVFLVVMILKAFFGSDFIMPTNLFIIMVILYIFHPAQIFWITRERYEYKYRTATVISILTAVLSQVVAIIAILFVNSDNAAAAKILGTGIGSLLFYIPIYILLLKKGKCGFDKQIWKYVLLFAIPLIPHYLAQHVMASADRIMIASLVSKSDAAIYSVVSTISLFATIVWSAINASLTPFVYEKLNIHNLDNIDKLVKELLVGYAAVCFLVTLIAPEVISILAPSEYYKGIYAVPPIAIVSFLNALYNTFSMIEFYHKKTGGIAIATIVSCVVNISLNYLFIPIFGFVAAAYTTLVSNLILVVLHYFFYRKCQAEPVYNIKQIAIITVLFSALCIICNILYANILMRYGVVVFVIIVCIMKRKTIILKIHQLRKRN